VRVAGSVRLWTAKAGAGGLDSFGFACRTGRLARSMAAVSSVQFRLPLDLTEELVADGVGVRTFRSRNAGAQIVELVGVTADVATIAVSLELIPAAVERVMKWFDRSGDESGPGEVTVLVRVGHGSEPAVVSGRPADIAATVRQLLTDPSAT
jgi:hypothetical protein